MVDKTLVSKKLERIETYFTQIRQRKDPGVERFSKDKDLQSIVLFNLIQLVQACIDIGAHIISDSGWDAPTTQANIFEILADNKIITRPLAAKMIQMVGFRNQIVHEYEKTDMKIVHTVWKKHLSDFDKFCKAIVSKYNL
ncbi:MAG: DUF86 domain-containing protein [Nitrospirae bacterium]|nr:DUF86 domain-containing protein [Nitrospirota bacterium]